MKHGLVLVALMTVFWSCYGTQRVNDQASDKRYGGFNEEGIGRTELIHFLRDKPGLQIVNRGGDYEVLVRGARSINGPNAPLYTLDGVAIGRDYNSVAQTVDVTQIASIRIITPANAAIYGSRGQNGVIAIKTKS